MPTVYEIKEAQEKQCVNCKKLVLEDGRQNYCTEMREILDIFKPELMETVLRKCGGPYRE